MYYNSTTGKVVTFGEVFLMVAPIELLKIQQSETLCFTFKGPEMAVAASLSNFGIEVAHVSSVSHDILGEAAIAFIKRYGIDTKYVNVNNYPLGFYVVESGMGIRPSKIANTRFKTAFEGMNPNYIDWDKAFTKCATFYWSLSSVASDGVLQTLNKALEKASQLNIDVIVDASVENSIRNPYLPCNNNAIKDLLKKSTIFIGGSKEINLILGTKFLDDTDGFIGACKALNKLYPNVLKFFDKVNDGQHCYSRGWTGKQYIETAKIALGNVLERQGTSEAFAAGIIYALRYYNYEHSLNFANAAFAIKHTIVGDFNVSTVAEVVEVLQVSK